MRRALAFKYFLENKQICINEGELIVGERGPAPKAVPDLPGDLPAFPGRPGDPERQAKSFLQIG